MSSSSPTADTDPLSLLRLSISQSSPPSLSHTPNPPPQGASPVILASASYLIFPSAEFPLWTKTRFHKTSGESVDLRSIYFAWLHREDTIPDYITKAQNLGDGVVTNLAFLERLELVTWLEGGQEESDFIKPLASTAASTSASAGAHAASAAPGSGATGAAAVGGQGVQSTPGGSAKIGGSSAALTGKVRVTDPRLLEIYSYERVLSNRNTFLRGIKPTDFSHVRKQAEDFITRLRNQKPSGNNPSSSSSTPGSHHHHPHHPQQKSLPHRTGHPAAGSSTSTTSTSSKSPSKSRSRDPIILLSPSASSLLTMANIKPFLENGAFISTSQLPGPHETIHQISRLIPAIHPTAPVRFLVVDNIEKFKPDYWDRVVGVFTTGQAWQFRDYKWNNPVELFRQVRGFYVGWDGEAVPDQVRGWGAGVKCLSIERGRRFRDREVCESIWDGIETGMKAKFGR
ncbi:CDC73-domain-containing protein [Choiromyces venosus 120613-1]|uniref:CDC73-domain-containing protein n=1 Tax=Choiromyces venosus 120613-1 TaxID=1336337 RepID=A0A3N4IYB1_9PEZI|nr:CDC73-domain-containing protein [Choiromyces venosus 120613-1]